MYRILICVILFFDSFYRCYAENHIAYNIPDPGKDLVILECTGAFHLCTDADKERLGREAVRAIHEQMDDDKDGMIEASESQDFIKEELESKTDSIRHRNFQNADLQITYSDLWTQWQKSPVYNWTTDHVVDWLINSVNLPMYVDNFRRNQFDGRMIPRLVINEKQYLSTIMQIRDTRHKRRLIIKATDVVLFGPPQTPHNLIKDMILMLAVFISFAACLYAFLRHRKTQESMDIMSKELEILQKAEGDLIAVTGKMKAMENEMKDKPKVDRGLLNTWFVEVQRTKDEAEKCRRRRDSTADHEKQLRLAVQEIEQLRIALRKAEEHAQHQSYEPPSELIDLLKRTYLIEEAAFEIKRKLAENAMQTAKDQMSKLSKMQKGFFGAVRIAHTGCIDDISELINSTKERLADVHDEYEERERRWNRIASLLDREDLVSNSSSSSASGACNQYLPGSPSTSLNNGLNQNSIPTDTHIRPKQQSSLDSNNLINSSIDSGSIRKSNSNLSIRNVLPNPTISIQTTIRDLMHRGDSGSEHSNSPLTVKRRTFTNSSLFSNHVPPDRLSLNQQIVSSRSANALNNSTESTRQSTTGSFEFLSTGQQSKPIFDMMTDSQIDNDESLFDDQDRKSQMSVSINSDEQSASSTGRKRRQSLTMKLLKPFQKKHSRKKSDNS